MFDSGVKQPAGEDGGGADPVYVIPWATPCLHATALGPVLGYCIVRENVRNTSKNVKSHDFLDFEKKA